MSALVIVDGGLWLRVNAAERSDGATMTAITIDDGATVMEVELDSSDSIRLATKLLAIHAGTDSNNEKET